MNGLKCSGVGCGILIASEAAAVYSMDDKDHERPYCLDCAEKKGFVKVEKATTKPKRGPRKDKGGKHAPKAGAFIVEVLINRELYVCVGDGPEARYEPLNVKGTVHYDALRSTSERAAIKTAENSNVGGQCRIVRQHGKDKAGIQRTMLVDVPAEG